MFDIGDLVVYGSTGVCRVEGCTTPAECSTLKGMEESRKYYVLSPVYKSGVIYAPAENPKISIRAVISADEANRLIDSMPSIDAEAFHSTKAQELKAHYQNASNTHKCADLVKLSMSIYAKKQYAVQQNRKFGQVDEHYMKQTEEMLYGEFATALGIEKDAVPAYIENRLKNSGVCGEGN